jgi:hypothetical protein
LRRSILAPPAQSWEDRTVIYSVGEHQWEDVNWNNEGHHTCINTELGTFCRLLYPGMVTVGDRRQAVRLWFH